MHGKAEARGGMGTATGTERLEMTHEIWARVCERLEGKVGRNNFVAWIDPLQFDSLSDGVLTFGVPSNFMGNWVDRYFRCLLYTSPSPRD